MGFLVFIFWAFVAVYVLGLVARWVLRRWLTRMARSAEQQAPPRPRRKEGSVVVEQVDKARKKVDGKVGEYVEFEEVK